MPHYRITVRFKDGSEHVTVSEMPDQKTVAREYLKLAKKMRRIGGTAACEWMQPWEVKEWNRTRTPQTSSE